ncbi:MAG: hypothetical protein PHX18_06430 [Candidatus Gastranaerophilales bacterium]|nr:hypothetical protein [Candidatus Gastranaerophilales bacterium]
MGCLKNIFSLVILILAIIGFISIGGVKFVQNGLAGMQENNQQQNQSK